MRILSSPTDLDLALYNIIKRSQKSQKEVSAATAELSSAKSLLHAPQSAPHPQLHSRFLLVQCSV